jgi:DNA-binding response OmpR family regulator
VKTPTILLVEDDAAVRQLFGMGLTLAGFHVDIAVDGVEALRKLDQQPPDLVVLDLDLPRLDGDTVLRELNASPAFADIPVIVVTGSDPSGAVALATAILPKPCEPEHLLAVIEDHLAA